MSAKNPNFEHNASGYVNHKCRCDICKAANTKRTKNQRKQRMLNLETNPPKVHNANTYTNWGCRCEICSQEHTKRYLEQKRERGKSNAK